MKKYMVELTLPDYIGSEFIALIPRHRMYIYELMENGVVSTYAIDTERSRGWVGMNAHNQEEIEMYIRQFPIADFITFEVHELLIFDNEAHRIPKMSLN